MNIDCCAYCSDVTSPSCWSLVAYGQLLIAAHIQRASQSSESANTISLDLNHNFGIDMLFKRIVGWYQVLHGYIRLSHQSQMLLNVLQLYFNVMQTDELKVLSCSSTFYIMYNYTDIYIIKWVIFDSITSMLKVINN